MLPSDGLKRMMAGAIAIGMATLGSAAVRPPQVTMNLALGNPVLLDGKTQKTYLRVGLSGIRPEKPSNRPPVNAAIVLDRSGSMEGEKLEKAKEAAQLLVSRLDERDTVCVVTFDDTVTVLVPATHLSDRRRVIDAISAIQPGGSTNIFGGVCKGAAELRKFREKNGINRVVLLSDGNANIGPATAPELGSLGNSLKKEDITVTTIGLGLDYNEDLMTALAERSDGSHAFVPNATDLSRIFALELGNLLSIVARNVEIKIECPAHIRPLRILGREGAQDGQTTYVNINQLYSGQETALVLEVEVEPGKAGSQQAVADVSMSYVNPLSGETERLKSQAVLTFSASATEVQNRVDRVAMATAVEYIANDTNKRAVALRDQGRIGEARAVLENNASYLMENSVRYKSRELERLHANNLEDSRHLDGAAWQSQRKQMMKWSQQDRSAARW